LKKGNKEKKKGKEKNKDCLRLYGVWSMEFLKLLKKLLITDYIRGSGKKNSGDQAQKTPEKLRGFRGSGKKNFLKLQKLRKNFGDQAPEKLRKNFGDQAPPSLSITLP
jgi:hypothetical protein